MKPTILFFGSSPYSVIILKALHQQGYRLQIITTPAKPQGRSKKPVSNSVNKFCQAQKLPCLELVSLTQIPSSITQPDLIITADYGLKILPVWLKLPQHGSLNLHPSLLPKYRGAAPVPWAILTGESHTGISIINMTEKVDRGPIIAQQTTPISQTDTSPILLKRCFTLGAKILIEILPEYIGYKSGQKTKSEQKKSSKYQLFLPPQPQPPQSPTPYARRFTKPDGFVSWQDFSQALTHNGQTIHRRIRALQPWPHTHTIMPNQQHLKLLSATLTPDNHLLPQQVQLSGKNPISWSQFLAGYQNLLK